MTHPSELIWNQLVDEGEYPAAMQFQAEQVQRAQEKELESRLDDIKTYLKNGGHIDDVRSQLFALHADIITYSIEYTLHELPHGIDLIWIEEKIASSVS